MIDDGPGGIAFYLPQFHPTPENDEWWGPGFTEWHNVVRARPAFAGHVQPRIPADLGFYDLRLNETRRAQGQLARDHGVLAFCYYHYWFGGRRLLRDPLDRMLRDDDDHMPFMLCWANESWTRNWTGRSGEILIQQRYSPDDDAAHIQWLLKVFEDPRYVRLDGAPVFLIYRADDLPDAAATTRAWRDAAHAHGFPDLLLGRVESFRADRGDPRPLGMDLGVEFQPDWADLPQPRVGLRSTRLLHRLMEGQSGIGAPRRYRYGEVVDRMTSRPAVDYPRFPGVTPRWDNTPRRASGATVLEGASPDLYERWLADALRRATTESPAPWVFINAWNEWAEGAFLEPDVREGHRFLEATAQAVEAERG